MLTITVKNDRIILDGLRTAALEMPGAIRKGLTKVAIGVHRSASTWLGGAGLGDTASGGYPVPVRTGHLRRLLDWLRPGASKSTGSGTFRAGDLEVVVYDSASYARAIHDGLGSSAKFGRRPFLEDGFKTFNGDGQVVKTIQAEIDQVLTGVKG